MSFKLKNNGKISYYVDELTESAGGLSHIFTTRLGGFSNGPLSSMNMSPTKEDIKTVIKNYKAICACENIPAEKCVLSHQTHTNNIRIVTEKDAGKRLFKPSDITDVDGLITNVPGLPIVIFYADCVPILLFDPVKKVIGTVHAGWRGTVNNIAGKAVNKMTEAFGTAPENIIASIGPSIGPCCFETGQEVRNEFVSAELSDCIIDKNIDLQKANKTFLQKAGVKKITISGLCTKCRCNEFFSHRGCGPDTGRMALIACLK